MHRLILNSATWQMSSLATDPRSLEVDPDNRLLSRMNRRRLESEALWDAVHSASGTLNLKAGGRPVMPALEADELAAIRDKYHWVVTADATDHSRRGLYMMSRRNFRLPFFDVFDSPPNAVSTGRRDSTTVAPQALWTLNNRRVFRLAKPAKTPLHKLTAPGRSSSLGVQPRPNVPSRGHCSTRSPWLHRVKPRSRPSASPCSI